MQPRYQIHIYHDGTMYVADVPELDGCKGTGQSYAEALASAEKKIVAWVFEAINGGRKLPEPAKDFVLRPPTKPPGNGSAVPIMRRLHHQFGNFNNRQLAEKMGLEGVSPTAFSAAAAGQGKRYVRIVIALALRERPSALWPQLSDTVRARDDATFMEAGGAYRIAAVEAKQHGALMDYDERQALYEGLVDEYRAMFGSMDDAARALWFTVSDESVILSFDVGKGETMEQAEERHNVKLLAIAMALIGLPCAEKERSTINGLYSTVHANEKRREAQRKAAGKDPLTFSSYAADLYRRTMDELKTEGKL